MDLLEYERECQEQGYQNICGIDEVGRGCLFGDVVAAAVILPFNHKIEGLMDSKRLSEKKREHLAALIKEKAIAYEIASVSAEVIDQINIKQATLLAMKQAVEALKVKPDFLLIDAETILSDIPQKAIIKGDTLSESIAAASIIAKVARDKMCTEVWHQLYPEYELHRHKGYGTKLHIERLVDYGMTPLHRKTFLKKYNTNEI